MLARPCHVIGRRRGVPRASRAEAPEIDEWAGAGIVGATAVTRGVQRRLQDREAILGQRDPGTGVGPIETAQVRYLGPVAHLRDNLVEHRADACLQAAAVLPERQHGADSPGRPHRLARPLRDRALRLGHGRWWVQRDGDENAIHRRYRSGRLTAAALPPSPRR